MDAPQIITPPAVSRMRCAGCGGLEFAPGLTMERRDGAAETPVVRALECLGCGRSYAVDDRARVGGRGRLGLAPKRQGARMHHQGRG